MSDHSVPDLRVQRIPEQADQREDGEEQDVERKQDVRDIAQLDAVIGQVVEEDGSDTGAHRNGEPRRGEIADDSTPSSLHLRVEVAVGCILRGLGRFVRLFLH